MLSISFSDFFLSKHAILHFCISNFLLAIVIDLLARIITTIYGGIMSFQKKLLSDIANIDREIAKLQSMQSAAPEGKLIMRSRKDGRTEYYQKIRIEDGKFVEKYIPQHNTDLISALAYKDYTDLRLNDLIKNKKVFQEHLDLIYQTPQSQKYLETHPRIGAIIKNNLLPVEERYRKWAESPYPRKNDKNDGLIYPTVIPDLFVRSKSEADISSRLVHFGIPFHFEEALTINGTTIYPDFKCISLSTGKFFWWEHQGMWDVADYVNNNVFRREQFYYNAGIIPWKNLIITTETRSEPLDIQWVDEIIKYFLL